MPRCRDCDAWFSRADGGCDCWVEAAEEKDRQAREKTLLAAPQKKNGAPAVKEPNWDQESQRLTEEAHEAHYGCSLNVPGAPVREARGEACPCCHQPNGFCPRCDAPHEKVSVDLNGPCCTGCAERDSEGDVVESEDSVFVFTFGYGHAHPDTGESLRNRFVEVQAKDYETAHEEMFRHFGAHWGLNYGSREEAQVERFGLKLLPREEWPKPREKSGGAA